MNLKKSLEGENKTSHVALKKSSSVPQYKIEIREKWKSNILKSQIT